MCGLEVQVTDGRVSRIRGDRDDVWSKGYLCPKGTALGALHHDPDRIRVPMIRTGDHWEEVDWDTRVRSLRRAARRRDRAARHRRDPAATSAIPPPTTSRSVGTSACSSVSPRCP